MVRRQIAGRGVRDERVLAAMRDVPREVFMPVDVRERAYDDAPAPIGEGQTISQPYIVALMAELLELNEEDRVLEVGAGCGYASAVLSRIVKRVIGIERHGDLAARAVRHLEELGYDNVRIVHADGTKGWEEESPYDAILVSAAADREPSVLVHQLAIGGRLVYPLEKMWMRQRLMRVRRVWEERYEREDLGAVSFVPLVEGMPGG